MLLFGYTDHEDDRLQVETRESGDFLAFRVPEDRDNQMDARGVDIPRDKVLELHAALGEWLYPVHTPEAPNRSLIEQMIEKAVKDQISAVLPLHLSPFATQMRAAEEKIGRVANALMADPDPEPGDVGHPRPAGPCGEAPPVGFNVGHVHTCGYVWGAHRPQETEPEHGRLMAELPRRTRTRAGSCLDCLHGWGEHTGGICWGGGQGSGVWTDVCDCTRERPA